MDNPDLADHHCRNPHISWTSAMTNHLTENARLRAALEAMLHAVCGETGFASAALRAIAGDRT